MKLAAKAAYTTLIGTSAAGALPHEALDIRLLGLRQGRGARQQAFAFSRFRSEASIEGMWASLLQSCHLSTLRI